MTDFPNEVWCVHLSQRLRRAAYGERAELLERHVTVASDVSGLIFGSLLYSTRAWWTAFLERRRFRMAAVQVLAERKCHGHDLVYSRVKEHGPEKHAPDARLRGHPARTGWPLAIDPAGPWPWSQR